jgi:redox-sensing transcriptional repressor
VGGDKLIRNRIPDVVIQRLITYLRILRDPAMVNEEYISSAQLAHFAGVNSAQVRKDLALFGEFGKQGVGYPVKNLQEELVSILGADRPIGIVIFGVGELGSALARFLTARRKENKEYRFILRALFDENPSMIGKEINGVKVRPLSALDRVEEPQDVGIGIVAVPAAAAQQVVDFAISKGIRGFVNFAPIKLKVPPNVRVQYTDVTLTLEELAFYL